MSDLLVAGDVRTRLFRALRPVVLECERALAVSPVCRPDRLRYVVQLHPLLLQVTIVPDEGTPARSIVTVSPQHLPDRGRALARATEEFATGVLSGLSEKAAVGVVAGAALAQDAGLCALLDPTDESATLFLAVPGKSLGEGVYLGALMDAPETAH